MVSREEYLADPCGALSIPLWKACRVAVPPHMRILHQREFSPELLDRWEDTVYFRLRHDLNIPPPPPPVGLTLRTAAPEELELMVRLINASYDDLTVTQEQLSSCAQTPVYAPELWLIARDRAGGQPEGCAISDYDPAVGEVILEWIQVLPGFRRRGVGRAMVGELLRRAPRGAAFATVSGKVDSPSRPEALYRACGFQGADYWHILTQKRQYN